MSTRRLTARIERRQTAEEIRLLLRHVREGDEWSMNRAVVHEESTAMPFDLSAAVAAGIHELRHEIGRCVAAAVESRLDRSPEGEELTSRFALPAVFHDAPHVRGR
jgi:hypothetical protein